MPQYVYKYNLVENATILDTTDLPMTQTNWSNFLMPPGVYSYNQYRYDLTQEGLYGFININVDGGRRIIYQQDVSALLSGLAGVCSYGRMDEGLTNSQLQAKAKTARLSMRCGRTIDFVRSVLTQVGVNSRICRLLTAEPPNGWDEGHVAVEVFMNGDWKFWDIANNFYPTIGGAQTTLDACVKNLSAAKVYIADNNSDILGAASNQFATDMAFDMLYRTRSNIDNWVNRIYKIPGIVASDGRTYFYMPIGTESRQSWVLSLDSNYRVVDYTAWKSMFY